MAIRFSDLLRVNRYVVDFQVKPQNFVEFVVGYGEQTVRAAGTLKAESPYTAIISQVKDVAKKDWLTEDLFRIVNANTQRVNLAILP